MPPGESYYWAGGRKVPLRPSDQVVVDLESTAVRGKADALGREGRRLMGSLVMVPAAAAREALGGAPTGLHPVYQAEDDTLIAVLPEIRVEAAPDRLEDVRRSVRGAHVTEHGDERLVLVPDSGRGEDALRIANELSEAGGLDVSQARFLRVVTRPGP